MDPKKLEIIKEILEHLSGHQAMGLKDLLDKSKAPKELPMEEGEPKEMGLEVDVIKPKEEPFEGEDKDPSDELHMPEGIKDTPEEGEMTDEELEELLSKLAG